MGKTRSSIRSTRSIGKHPHTRGEDRQMLALSGSVKETPPHAWGRRLRSERQSHIPRNTPTRVGKTLGRSYATSDDQKHPHTRGEDLLGMPGTTETSETPPHAWGRLKSASPVQRFLRNTPTRVGKTMMNCQHRRLGRKHPHTRGEDLMVIRTAVSSVETPPHAWGRHRHRNRAEQCGGNTPTRVGKTATYRQRCRSSTRDVVDNSGFRVSTISCMPETSIIGLRGGPMQRIS